MGEKKNSKLEIDFTACAGQGEMEAKLYLNWWNYGPT